MNAKKRHPSFAKSVGFAMRGLLAAARGERNFRFHLCAFAAVVALAFLLRLTALEWIAVLVCSAVVLGAELFNTAIETVVDLVRKTALELMRKGMLPVILDCQHESKPICYNTPVSCGRGCKWTMCDQNQR